MKKIPAVLWAVCAMGSAALVLAGCGSTTGTATQSTASAAVSMQETESSRSEGGSSAAENRDIETIERERAEQKQQAASSEAAVPFSETIPQSEIVVYPEGTTIADLPASQTATRFSSVTASSTRAPEPPYSYPASNVLVDDDTCWVEGAAGNGVGEFLSLSASGEQAIQGIWIRNGYHKADVFSKNGRVAQILLEFSDGSSFTTVLQDTGNLQWIPFGRTVTTQSVKLTIQSVYPGSTWEDVCLSYVNPTTKS